MVLKSSVLFVSNHWRSHTVVAVSILTSGWRQVKHKHWKFKWWFKHRGHDFSPKIMHLIIDVLSSFSLVCLHTNTASLRFYLPYDNSPQVWCVQYQYLHKAAKVTALCYFIICNCKCMLWSICVCVCVCYVKSHFHPSMVWRCTDNSVSHCKQACKRVLPSAAVGVYDGGVCVRVRTTSERLNLTAMEREPLLFATLDT